MFESLIAQVARSLRMEPPELVVYSKDSLIVKEMRVDGLPTSQLKGIHQPLYKYMRWRDAESLLSRGSIRVGTMYEYRDEERFGSQVGDSHEGLRIVHDNPGELVLQYPSDWQRQSDVFNQLFTSASEGVGTYAFRGLAFGLRFVADDVYVFSTSDFFDQRLYRAFDGVEYDTCVCIEDPQAFFAELDRAVRAHVQVSDWSVARCLYGIRNQHHATAVAEHPALLKASRHRPQREIRGMWLPEAHAPVGLIIPEWPPLARLCRLHDRRA